MNQQATNNAFVEGLLDAVADALETGKPARLTVKGGHSITIDIYESQSQMLDFDEAALALAKQHKGSSAVKSTTSKGEH